MQEKTIFVGLVLTFSLLLSTLTINSGIGTTQNTNDTKMIVNVKNRTISVVDTRTNETISVRNFATGEGNMTTDESISTNNLTANTGNMITNESLSINNVSESAENSTTILNLTDKFKELQNQ